MPDFNDEKMTEISDFIIRALNICLQNKQLWKDNKESMMELIKLDNFSFYDKYPRICRILVYGDDIQPLLTMIQTFSKVQTGTMRLDEANDTITSGLNAKYIDGVLNSEKLTKEREEKQKLEKIKIIQ